MIDRNDMHNSSIFGQVIIPKDSSKMRICRCMKRIADVVLAIILLLVALPLLVFLAALVKRDGGTAFFRQQRVGLDGRLFMIIKIRSMVIDAEEILRQDSALYQRYIVSYSLPDDSRVTSAGRLLRATHLDEIPQLWNVIRGDMSLVGPRPVLAEETEQYGDLKREILSVRPGLTGLWQINRNLAPEYPERACMEASYVHNWSLLQDIKLILSTIVYIWVQVTREIIDLISKKIS